MQIGRGFFNFELAFREMNFRKNIASGKRAQSAELSALLIQRVAVVHLSSKCTERIELYTLFYCIGNKTAILG